jgi:hypothetical protein
VLRIVLRSPQKLKFSGTPIKKSVQRYIKILICANFFVILQPKSENYRALGLRNEEKQGFFDSRQDF